MRLLWIISIEFPNGISVTLCFFTAWSELVQYVQWNSQSIQPSSWDVSSSSHSPDGPLRRPMTWPLKISVLHRDESGIALASSWTRLSQVRRGRPGGLVQLDDGFLPSWLFTIKSKALFAGTSGSRRATWPKRDRRRRRISLIVGRPVFWSTSALVIYPSVAGIQLVSMYCSLHVTPFPYTFLLPKTTCFTIPTPLRHPLTVPNTRCFTIMIWQM